MATHDADPPTLDEVFQAEDYAPNDNMPVAVTIADPVKVQNLPCVASGMKRYTFRDGTSSQRILPNDPKRSHALIKIITDGGIFHMGQNQGQSLDANAPQWAGSIPLEWNTRDELWASAPIATAAVPVVITVASENWAS